MPEPKQQPAKDEPKEPPKDDPKMVEAFEKFMNTGGPRNQFDIFKGGAKYGSGEDDSKDEPKPTGAAPGTPGTHGSQGKQDKPEKDYGR